LASFSNCRARNQPCFFASSAALRTMPLPRSAAGREDHLRAHNAHDPAALDREAFGHGGDERIALAAHTMASAMPVLPEVASTTVWPGLSAPLRSASSMMGDREPVLDRARAG